MIGKALQIYLASPLFTAPERRGNRELAAAIEKECGARVFLPQDLKHGERYNDRRAFGVVFKACIDAIAASDCVIAWLDGADADSGTSFEAGFAYARGIPVIGVRTDFRPSQERGVNIMLSRACFALVTRPSFDENNVELAREIVRALRKIHAKNAV